MKKLITTPFLSSWMLATLLIFGFGLQNTSAQSLKRIYANSVEKSDDEYLPAGMVRSGYVLNETRAVDQNVKNAATLKSTVVEVATLQRIGADAVIRLRFTGADKPAAGTPLTIKLGLGGDVLSVLGGISIQAINGTGDTKGIGNEVGPAYSGTALAGVLAGTNVIEFTITPTVQYDGIKIKLGVGDKLLAAGLSTQVDVYHAYFNTFSSGMICQTPIDVLYGSTGSIAGGLNPVEDPYNAIDGNPASFALLRANVSAINKTYVTGMFPILSKSGDSVKVIIRPQSTGLLDATLISSNLRIRTYNNSTEIEQLALKSPTLSLKLFGGTTNTYELTYPVTAPFNRVQVSLGEGLLNAFSGLFVHEISTTAPRPKISSPGLVGNKLTVCEGESFVVSVTDPEVGATYRWFDSAVGGTEITSGVTDNGKSFSPGGLAAGTHKFYVAMYRNGCTDAASQRTELIVVITPAATAAQINAPGTSICIGQIATLVTPVLTNPGSIINPIFTWYLDAARTSPITNTTVNGVTYTVNPNGSLTVAGLTTTRDYYVSLRGDGFCETPAGALKNVTLTVNTITAPVLNLSGSQTFALGSTMQLTANSPDAVSYSWFKDGIQITGTSSTLTIANMTNADAGVYTAKAIGLGSCSSIASASVTINVKGFGTTKTVSGLNTQGKIAAGSELTYSITISNTTNTPLSNVTITDQLPVGTSFVSANNSGVNTNGTVSWTVNVPAVVGLTPGTITVELKVLVNSNLTGITSINNIAIVTNPADPGNPQRPETGPIPTAQMPSFTSVKLGTGLNPSGLIDANSELTYTIQITNTGNTSITGMTISDVIPSNTTYVAGSATNGGSLTGSTLNWTLDVPFSSSRSLSFKVKVASDLTNVFSIGNIATVTDPSGTKQTPTVAPVKTNQIRQFTSTKTMAGANSSGKITPGSELTYTINMVNTGNVDLTGLEISDPIPANTTYIAGSASNGGILTGGILNWTQTIPFGTSRSVSFRVKVNDDLTGVSSIGNRATIVDPTKPGPPDNPEVPPVDTDVPRTYTSSKTMAGANPSGLIDADSELTYTIQITNTGNTSLTGMTISDVIPANTTYVAGSASNGGTLTGSTLNWTLDVPFGSSRSISFKVKVVSNLTNVSSIGNIATVKDPSGVTQTPTVAPINTNQIRQFTSTKTMAGANSSGKITPGSELTYTINMVNTGNVDLTGLEISDPIPAATTYIAESASNGGTLTGGILNWTQTIPYGTSRSVSFRVRVNDDLTNVPSIGNRATIVDPKKPNPPQNPEVPPVPTESKQTYTSSKSMTGANPSGLIDAGSELTYTIQITNIGNSSLTGMTISDVIPSNTTYVAGSASNGGTLTGSTLNWTLDVPFGSSRSLSFKVKVTSNLTNVSSIGNIATVRDPSGGIQTPTVAPVNTNQIRLFTSTKTMAGANSSGKITPGSELTYTINMVNTGNVDLTGLKISDPIPANTTYIAESASNGGILTGGVLNWTQTIPFGTSRSVSFRVKVIDDLTGVPSIGNRATIVDPEKPGPPDNPEVPPVETERRTFTSTKTMAGANASGKITPGSELTYTINMVNTGNVDLTGLVISDPIPANTAYIAGSASNGGTLTGGILNWTQTIPIGTSRSVSFRVKVNDDLTGVSSIGNRATIVDPAKPVPPQHPEVPPVPTDVDYNYDLASLVKSNGPDGKARSGNRLDYTISVINTGNATLLNAIVANPVPGATSLLALGTAGVYDAATKAIKFSIPEIPSKATRSVTFSVVVDDDLSTTSVISNNAAVEANKITKQTTATIETACTTKSPSAFALDSGAGIGGCITPGSIIDLRVSAIGIINPIFYLYRNNSLISSNKTGVFSQRFDLPGSYTYSAGVSSGGLCITPDNARLTLTLNVGFIPNTPVPTNPITTVCEGSSASLSIQNPQDNVTYNWYTAATGGQLAGTGTQFTTPAITGAISYYIEAVGPNGCINSSRTETLVRSLSLPAAPPAAIVGGFPCIGNSATLAISNPNSSLTYTWYSQKTGGIPVHSGVTFVTPALSTNTTYYAEASSGSCVSSSRTEVLVKVFSILPAPVVAVTGTSPSSVTFEWPAIADAVGYSISLDKGITWTNVSLKNSYEISGLKPNETRSIIVKALGPVSCSDSAISASVSGTSSNPMGNGIFVPNTFSPNGDGRNEQLLVYGNTINQLKFSVFNQWGQQVFFSDNQSIGWDGTFKGAAQPSGIYVYYLEAISVDGTRIQKRGTSAIIR